MLTDPHSRAALDHKLNKQVDKMLDEELLVGPGRQARDTLRPLAYSTLADLVHHVKDQIDLKQVSRVIQVR